MSISRRNLLKGAMATGVLGSAGLANFALPTIAKAADLKAELAKHRGRQIVVTTWGGSTADAFRAAYFKPFKEEFGIEIIEDSPPKNARMISMVQSGNVSIDIADIGTYKVHALGQQGVLEKIDYSVVDASGIPESSVNEFGVGNYSWTQLLAYRTDTYADNAPKDITALFDTKTYPGMRGLRDDPIMNMAYALQAAGYAKDEIYPLTQEKIKLAYEKLDSIKDNVIWWTSGAQTQQLISTNEVSMIGMWNGRVDKLLEEKLPIGVVWTGTQFATDSWVMLKGAPNKDVAMLFIAWTCLPENNAKFSDHITYGPVNKNAFGNVKAERKSMIPSTYIDDMVICDYQFWGENYTKIAADWKEWRLS